MPKTFKFKDGKTLDFEPFSIKDENMRKIRIHRDGGDGEGIWAAFSDEGLKNYADDNSHGKVIPCILVNAALNFYPNNSWGLYIPVTTHGTTRPECNLTEVNFDVPIFCQEREDAVAKEKK